MAPSCARWTWPSMPLPLALERPEKERGFSLSPCLLSKPTCSRQSSAASGGGSHAETAACSVCHVPQQSTVRWLQAVRGGPGRPCHCRLRLSDPKKREGSPHLS